MYGGDLLKVANEGSGEGKGEPSSVSFMASLRSLLGIQGKVSSRRLVAVDLELGGKGPAAVSLGAVTVLTACKACDGPDRPGEWIPEDLEGLHGRVSTRQGHHLHLKQFC